MVENMDHFTEIQIERYGRNILLKGFGLKGQSRLMESKVLIIGIGGLGSPAALYLAAAGVGTIGLADGDVVEISNLQRQIIHDSALVGAFKTTSAASRIKALNPDVRILRYNERINAKNISEIITEFDFLIDGTDTFGSKFLINDACVKFNVPFSHAGVVQYVGQTMTVVPRKTACYRCMFQSPPPSDAVPNCSQAGILGSVAGILGCIQATEAVKYLIGKGDLLGDVLLHVDAETMEFRKIPLKRRESCPVCSLQPEQIVVKEQEEEQCQWV